jgi:outer membrane autotransporter protein
VADAIVAMPTSAQQNAALDKLGGEVYADLLTAGRDSARAFLGGLSDQLSADASANSIGAGAGKTAVWGRAFGSFGSVYGGDGAHGFSNDAGGAIFGVERAWGADTVVGASATYGHTDLSLKGLAQSGALDTGAIALYGERRFGMVFVDGALSWDYDHDQADRTIALPGIDRRAASGFSGDTLGGLVEAGVRIERAGFLWQPSVGVLYSQVSQHGVTENGAGGADLSVRSQSLNAAESLVGVRVSRVLATLAGGTWKVDGRVAWAHELGDTTPQIGESFAAASGANFVLDGARLDTDHGVVGAGLSYQRSQTLSFYARYGGDLGSQQTQNAVTLGARFAW